MQDTTEPQRSIEALGIVEQKVNGDAKEGTINQIYDKILKRILVMSRGAVINLINALFKMNFPLDSEIVYNLTENTDDKLGRTLQCPNHKVPQL